VGTLDSFIANQDRRARFSVRPRPLRALPPVAGLLAGAAEVDITPPPGMPKAGYSKNAHDGDGFRTRLRARVVHLRAGTTSIAIVQCDLLGGSAVVQHLVADAIADRTDIPLAGLMIGATHTHAGPGQFLGNNFYNRFASNRPGFDPAWTQFLVDRIADACIRAYEQRMPARLAIGTTELRGLTRNRSLDPYVQNDTVTDKRQDPQRKFVSVNPELHVLRVDSAAGDPIAATVVFSVHGTGISHHTLEYNADVWAYIIDALARRVGSGPVLGAIEGTHADVAPAIRPGLAGHLEAKRIGHGIGACAADLYDALSPKLSDDIALGCGFREVDLAVDRTITNADGTRVTLPRRPAAGAALVAGATENTTPVISKLPPFRPGMPKPRWGRNDEHAQKWVIGSRWGQPLVIPLEHFPHVIPFQVLRIGAHTIVGLPYEVTTESGRRIASEVGNENVPDTKVIVSSVANEYTGYVTTPEEYTRQFYEGGHTIYGPNTLAFLAAHSARLARDVEANTNVSDPLTERTFDVKAKRYLAAPTHETVERRFATAARFTDPTRTEDAFWEIEWLDAAPGDLTWHEPLVHVVDEAGTTVADDQRGALDVTYLGVTNAGHRYRTRWYDPAFGPAHRFVLAANAGRPQLTSPPFD
jgi:neutral ceramidase